MANKGLGLLWSKMKQHAFRGHIGSAFDEMERRRQIRQRLAELIAAEGGEVSSVREMGLLLVNPFGNYSKFGATYWEAKCRYANDAGTWYICYYDDEESRWLWRSGVHNPSLPRARKDGAIVRTVWQVPYWTSNVLALVIAGIVVWLIWPLLQP